MFFALARRGTNVTETRDRIFSQLGIVKELARKEGVPLPTIRPNYARAIPELDFFRAVAVDLIKAMGRIAYLSAYEDVDFKRRSDILSWIPEFSLWNSLNTFYSANVPWNADGMNGKPVPTRHLSVDGNFLLVQGFQVGQIDSVIATKADMENYSCPWVTRLRGFQSKRYPRNKTEIFWRTCICNMSGGKGTSWNTASGDHFRCFVILCTLMGYKGPDPTKNPNKFNEYAAAHPLKLLALSDESKLVPYMPNHMEFAKAIVNRPEARSYQGDFRTAAPGIMKSRSTEFYIAMTKVMMDRHVVSTAEGHLTNVPTWSKKGDRIIILKGSPCPLVLSLIVR